MPRPRIVRPNAGAEVAMVIAARRQARAAFAAVLAVVERTWPETTEADVRRAIRGALDRKAFVAAAVRQALAISRANHRQLSKAIPGFPKWNEAKEQAAARAEAAEQWLSLVERLVGSSRDDSDDRRDAAAAEVKHRIENGPHITLDEITAIHDRGRAPVSMLNSMMGRLRAKRATNEEILGALSTLREVAPEEELGAIARVRTRVFRWEAKRNEEHQAEAGIKRYIWRTKRDSRVRASHFMLEGTEHRWSAPPLVDGKRIHPGGTYGCRCIAEPIINRESQRIARRQARAAAE